MSSTISFHSRQAAWQALQPMHLETSMSFATSVCRSAGGSIREAERRIRSASPNFGGIGSVVGFGIGGNMSRPPYATGSAIGAMSTRNALNSGVSALASATGGVSELIGEAFLVRPMKPKCSGRPTVWTSCRRSEAA